MFKTNGSKREEYLN